MSQTISERLEKNRRRDSWRAGCIEMVHVRFGGEGLVCLGDQDPASYPTRVAGGTCHNRMVLEGREMRKPFLILTAMRCFSGKPSALKGTCSVWERGVGNVLTTRVRDRRVPVANALASPFGNEVTH
jgi:hypothetical protein